MAEINRDPAVDPNAELSSADFVGPGGSNARARDLQAMQEQLRRHSALEDLGPLFAPEAQGRQPSGQPAPRRRQA